MSEVPLCSALPRTNNGLSCALSARHVDPCRKPTPGSKCRIFLGLYRERGNSGFCHTHTVVKLGVTMVAMSAGILEGKTSNLETFWL